MTTPLLALFVGDVDEQPSMQVKYGNLVDAIERRWPGAAYGDVSEPTVVKLVSAARRFSLDRDRWRNRVWMDPSAFVARSRAAAKRVRERRPDVILQHGVLFDATALGPTVIYTDYTAALSARRPDSNRFPLDGRARRRWLALERTSYHRAAAVCVRSTFVARSVVEDYGVEPSRVVVVGGGVNFASLPDPRRVPSPTPTFLFIGKDFYRKGGDTLLAAFADLRRDVDARLLLVTEDAPHRLPPGAEVVTPTWDRTVVADLYRASDVFVLPARLETWGDVLLEAMSFGLPCIGVADTAMADIVVDGETGTLVPVDDVASLAEAMRALADDERLRARLGVAARRRVEERFTWDAVVDRLAPAVDRAAREG